MNKELIFAFGENMIRVGGDAENPLFVVNDLCRALEISNPRDAVAHFPESEKGVVLNDTLGGRQEMLAVTEGGLYRLIFRSDKAAARAFQDWVFREVLPSIRKNGHYSHEIKLWEAFAQAKTGTVQAMILRQLGVGARPPQEHEVSGSFVSPDQVWRDIGRLAGEDATFCHFFRVTDMGGAARSDRWGHRRLDFAPGAVLAVLRKNGDEACRELTGPDFRRTMASSADWATPENLTARFRGVVMHAWRFNLHLAKGPAWEAAEVIASRIQSEKANE